MRVSVSGLILLLCAGCATMSPLGAQETVAAPRRAMIQPASQGSYHLVRRGETVWRIAQAFGISPQQLAAANRLSSTHQLTVGQRLFIPLPTETNRFLWPVRGTVRMSSTSNGLDIAAPGGSLVRASRSGVVAVATRHLYGWGKTVVLDHQDGSLSIYCGLEQILVPPGVLVQQGAPLGSLGSQALHFQIRQGARARSGKAMLALLPRTP